MAYHVRAERQLVWVDFKGWIVREGDRSFGISAIRSSRHPLTVPKSIAGLIRYVDDHASREVKFDHEFTALQVELWFAKKNKLIKK